MPFESRGAALHRGRVIELADCLQPPPHIVELDAWRDALELLELEPGETVEESAAALERWATVHAVNEVIDGLTEARFYEPAEVETMRRGGFSAELDVRALWVGAALVARLFPEQLESISGSRLVVELLSLDDEELETDDPDRLHDLCVRLLRDAEPIGGPLCRHYDDAAVYAQSLPRELRALLGVRIIDRRHELTTIEIHTHLVYPRSMVGVPFESGAY